MLLDALTVLMNQQTVTGGTARGDVYDFLLESQHGDGDPLYFAVFAHGLDNVHGDETYNVFLVHGTATNGTLITANRHEIPGTRLTFDRNESQALKYVQLPGGEQIERFVQANVTNAGTSPSITLTAWLTYARPRSRKAYPDAISFSERA